MAQVAPTMGPCHKKFMQVLLRFHISVLSAKYLYFHRNFTKSIPLLEKQAKLASLIGFGVNTKSFKIILALTFREVVDLCSLYVHQAGIGVCTTAPMNNLQCTPTSPTCPHSLISCLYQRSAK